MANFKYETVSDVLGLQVAEDSPFNLIELSRIGVPRQALDNLAKALQTSPLEIAKFLPVSQRTLQRYESSEKMSPAISDHVIQIASVLARAIEVFGDADNAADWLKESNMALGGDAPLSLLDTYSGIKVVLGELTRTEHGVIS